MQHTNVTNNETELKENSARERTNVTKNQPERNETVRKTLRQQEVKQNSKKTVRETPT